MLGTGRQVQIQERGGYLSPHSSHTRSRTPTHLPDAEIPPTLERGRGLHLHPQQPATVGIVLWLQYQGTESASGHCGHWWEGGCCREQGGQEVTTYSPPAATGDLRASSSAGRSPGFRESRNRAEQRGLWRWKEGGEEALTNFPTLHPPPSQGEGGDSQLSWGYGRTQSHQPRAYLPPPPPPVT